MLVLGAGPDAMPLVEIAALMNWQVTVRDHRPAYAVTERFPQARHVVLQPATGLAEDLRRNQYEAAVVMSHHLTSDQMYLAALADSAVPYVGLLGPAPRRERLMAEIGSKAAALKGRLHGPIGLDIGARTPETIALAIVSEIQAVLAGRAGGSFSHHAASAAKVTLRSGPKSAGSAFSAMNQRRESHAFRKRAEKRRSAFSETSPKKPI